MKRISLIKNNKGFSLVEVVIVASISSVIFTTVALSMFTFRNNVAYDVLFHEIIETINDSRAKAVASRLDTGDNRISYSIKFLENQFVEFEGDVYVDGADGNIEHTVPFGFNLSSSCSPNNDGTITFSPINGVNLQNCTVSINKIEGGGAIGSIEVGKYGIEQTY